VTEDTQSGQPLRTIRVLMAGAEETGLWGSQAYSKAHPRETIAVGLESDFGADRIWRFDSNFRDTNPALHKRIAAAVARFVPPEEFDEFRRAGEAKGFLLVAASPLTRSSYHADDDFRQLQKARADAAGR